MAVGYYSNFGRKIFPVRFSSFLFLIIASLSSSVGTFGHFQHTPQRNPIINTHIQLPLEYHIKFRGVKIIDIIGVNITKTLLINIPRITPHKPFQTYLRLVSYLLY